MKIESTQVQMNIETRAIFPAKLLAELNENVALALKAVDMMPDGPAKQLALADKMKSKRLYEIYATGFSCSIQSVSSYSLSGSNIKTTTISSKTVCEPKEMGIGAGNENPMDSSANYELLGDTLKITSDTVIKDDTESDCGKGDQSISTFERVK